MYRDNFSAKKVLELDKKGSYEKDGLFYKSANQFVELRLNKILYSDGLTKSHYVIPVAYIYDLEQRFIGYCTRMQYDFKTIENNGSTEFSIKFTSKKDCKTAYDYVVKNYK